MNEKLYDILNKKLFDIADLHYEKANSPHRQEPRHERLGKKIVSSSPVSTSFGPKIMFPKHVWRSYLDEMGIVKAEGVEQRVLPVGKFLIVADPLVAYEKLGVPEELAMKALALGYFPDSPSIENMRETALEEPVYTIKSRGYNALGKTQMIYLVLAVALLLAIPIGLECLFAYLMDDAEKNRHLRETSDKIMKENRHDALLEAATRLYECDFWKPTRMSEDEASKAWEALRDAIGLSPGTATQCDGRIGSSTNGASSLTDAERAAILFFVDKHRKIQKDGENYCCIEASLHADALQGLLERESR